MKDTLFLITVLVCTSMIEVSSARWAKNQVETIQNHHYKTAVAQGTFYTNIQKVLNVYVHHSIMMISLLAMGTPVTKNLTSNTRPASVLLDLIVILILNTF